MYYSDYFVFLCVFAFFQYEQLVPLLFYMTRVYSNIFITQEQFMIFIKSYNLPEEMYKQFKDFYNNLEHESSYNYHIFILLITI